MTKVKSRPIKVGPKDHGKRMSLDKFDLAEAQEGYRYELNKGVIEVTDIPVPAHGRVVMAVRSQISLYERAHPTVVNYSGGAGSCKMLIGKSQSERLPDFSIYLFPPPIEDHEVWSVWVPEIAIEVVSESSVQRDYDDKPAEYFEFGVKEYWIVDPIKNKLTVLTRWRGNQWQTQVLKPTQKYKTVLLPGFSLDLKRVLAAGKK